MATCMAPGLNVQLRNFTAGNYSVKRELDAATCMVRSWCLQSLPAGTATLIVHAVSIADPTWPMGHVHSSAKLRLAFALVVN
jgi:hypothetical protein